MDGAGRRPVKLRGQKVSGVIEVPGAADPLWYPAVRPDQQVAQGAVLGRLTDYFGATLAEVTAPLAGVVLYVVASPAMGKGEPLGMVGAISAEAPRPT
jgi:predicted deacylase